MPTYIKTGYWDKLSKAPKGYLNLDLITGGGGSVTSITKTELDSLVSSNGLTPGAYYLISGVDEPLYGGTTILIQASTTNTLALAGHGIFYNPKYLNSQDNVYDGYGIWSNYIKLSMFNIVGTFNNGDTVTADNGATATYLANDFLQWISGDWSLATSIDNDAGATADVSGGVSPSYNIGDDAIWGGKHWTNTSGDVGTADDKYTLSSADWEEVPFDDVNYNVVVDVIHYDQSHDMIIRRKDKWNNDVDGNFLVFVQFANYYGNPIKDFQWGNGPEDFNTDDSEYIGVISNYVKDSYLECINFIGHLLYFNTLTHQSDMYANITDTTSNISNNTLNDYSSIIDNVLVSNSTISQNLLESSKIQENLFYQFSGISGNTIKNSEINENTLEYGGYIGINVIDMNSEFRRNILTNGSQIKYNTLNKQSVINDNTISGASYIQYNTLDYSAITVNDLNDFCQISYNQLITSGYIDSNTLINNSYIESNKLINNSNITNNTLTDSSINTNTLTSSNIDNNTLDSNSSISNNTVNNGDIADNTLGGNSEINQNILNINDSIVSNTLGSNSYMINNVLNNSIFNFSTSGSLINKNIQNIEANYAYAISINISSATIIYGDYSKQMFRNSSGVVRLGYYNASNVFTVVNVNA